MKIVSKYLPIALFASFSYLTGCATTGIGTGEGDLILSKEKNEPVKFIWKSTDGGQTGMLTATLPHAVYQGPFFQITHHIDGEALVPLWTGWNDGWDDWPYWGFAYVDDFDTMQFISHYSGKVVANLSGPGNKKMRCRFYLSEPEQGMPGGGRGECQLSDGHIINASIDPLKK